jgi:hypothetical protein
VVVKDKESVKFRSIVGHITGRISLEDSSSSSSPRCCDLLLLQCLRYR